MRRRQFLTAAAAGTATLAVAGCIGMGDEDLEAEIEALEAELEDKEDEIASLQTEIDELEGDAAALEEKETELKQRLVDRYDRTQDLWNAAADWLEDGESLLENDQYPEAAGFFAGASRYLDSVSYEYLGIAEVAGDMDYPDAGAMADDAAQASANLREAAWLLSTAAIELEAGNDQAAEDAADEADEYNEAAEAIDVANAGEFGDALEL